MKNQTEFQPSVVNAPAVTDLTAEQTDQVAGGSLVLAPSLLRGGCPACTSGQLSVFANLAAIVNPAPEMEI
jgi:hypothetical protein